MVREIVRGLDGCDRFRQLEGPMKSVTKFVLLMFGLFLCSVGILLAIHY